MLLAALAVLALAEPPAPGRSADADLGRIERVEVQGARRTAPEAVRGWVGVAPGEPFDPAAIPALEQRLMNRRLFRSVRIRGEPGASGMVLRVEVEERVTLVPIPLAFASRGVVTGGVVVLDADAFGRGDSLALGALASNRGSTGFGLYRSPGVAGSRALLAARLGAGDTRREQYEGRDRTYAYRDRYLESALAGGWRPSDRWEVLGGWFERRAESQPTPGFAPPPPDGPAHGPTVELGVDATDFEGWRTRGIAGRAELRQAVRLGSRDRRPRFFTASASWSGRALGDDALSLTLRVDHVRGDPVLDAVRLGGIPGSRGFRTQGLWAEDAVTAALEDQVPVWRPTWGVVAGAAFVDAGAARWRGEETRWVAGGTGLRVYLRNVAIPVLGFDIAWATGVDAPAFSVQLGFRR
jgi:hypothetical protein